mmetsp:Transcript_31497/g.72454  ORF Transcript_31497/g.72454 Transcript_31497/m.72454 type:complete len:200 (-) Transcript_31497:550-1149(-)
MRFVRLLFGFIGDDTRHLFVLLGLSGGSFFVRHKILFQIVFPINSLFGSVRPTGPSQTDNGDTNSQKNAQDILLAQLRIAGGIGILGNGRITKIGGVRYNHGTGEQAPFLRCELQDGDHNAHDERDGNKGIVGTTSTKVCIEQSNPNQTGREQHDTRKDNGTQPSLTGFITLGLVGFFYPRLIPIPGNVQDDNLFQNDE